MLEVTRRLWFPHFMDVELGTMRQGQSKVGDTASIQLPRILASRFIASGGKSLPRMIAVELVFSGGYPVLIFM